MNKTKCKGKVTVGVAMADGTWTRKAFETVCSAEALADQAFLLREAKTCLNLGNKVSFVAMLDYKPIPDDPLADFEAPFSVQGWFEEMADPDGITQSWLKVVDVNEEEVFRIRRLSTRHDELVTKRKFELATRIAKLLNTNVREFKWADR